MTKTVTFLNVNHVKKRCDSRLVGVLGKVIAFLLFIVLQHNSVSAQSSGGAVSKPIQMVLTSQGSSIEKRAALRILLSHSQGNVITAYRLKDKSFLLTSSDESTAESLRADINRLYPEVKIKPVKDLNYESDGFVKVTGRVIKNDASYPQYIETGDHELDELSYSFEKQNWLKENPSKSK